jgi:hypothetical protein
MRVVESYNDGDQAWDAGAYRYDDGTGDEPGVVTAEAYCRAGTNSFNLSTSAEEPIGPAPLIRPVTVAAECYFGTGPGTGSFATAASMENGNRPLVRTSMATATGWLAIVDDPAKTPRGMGVDVDCTPVRRVPVEASSALTGEEEAGVTTPSCPAGTTALSGGFEASPPVFDSDVTVIFESVRAGDAWLTTARHFGSATSGSVRSLGYCG